MTANDTFTGYRRRLEAIADLDALSLACREPEEHA